MVMGCGGCAELGVRRSSSGSDIDGDAGRHRFESMLKLKVGEALSVALEPRR